MNCMFWKFQSSFVPVDEKQPSRTWWTDSEAVMPREMKACGGGIPINNTGSPVQTCNQTAWERRHSIWVEPLRCSGYGEFLRSWGHFGNKGIFSSFSVQTSREPGWLEGTLNGKRGLIPQNYVKLL